MQTVSQVEIEKTKDCIARDHAEAGACECLENGMLVLDWEQKEELRKVWKMNS